MVFATHLCISIVHALPTPSSSSTLPTTDRANEHEAAVGRASGGGGGHIISEVSVFSERDGIFGCGSYDFLSVLGCREYSASASASVSRVVVDVWCDTCHWILGSVRDRIE